MSNTEKSLQELKRLGSKNLTLYKKLETKIAIEDFEETLEQDEKLSDLIDLEVLDSTRLIELIKEWEQINSSETSLNDSIDSFESYIRTVYASELEQAHISILRNLAANDDLPF